MKAAILTCTGQRDSAFGSYLGEILRAEGLNWHEMVQFTPESAEQLGRYGLVMLPRCFPAKAEIEGLVEYVRDGGRLVCFRPSLRLGEALGLKPTYAARKGGYLLVDRAQAPGSGMPALSVQVHGMADHWEVPASSALSVAAALGEYRDGPWGAPGLVWGGFGKGRVACFSYDLPATVAAIRQGDRQRANTLTSGFDGNYRALDLYVGHLDVERALIPQADVHMALLTNVIDALLERPAPRLWYYPEPSQRSVLVMTSDDDWSQVDDFEALMEAVESRGGAITFYLVPNTRVSPEQAEAWGRCGHAFSVHPDFSGMNDGAGIPGPIGLDEQVLYMDQMLEASVGGFRQRFGLPVRTIRHHCVRWHGYADTARALARLGVQMDTNNYAGMPYAGSYMAGSGRPMRFVDERGDVIALFQQPTLFSEDTTIGAHSFSPQWSTADVVERARRVLDESIVHYYTPFCLNIHPLTYKDYSGGMTRGILDLAVARDVPILSADQWLDFTLARYGSEVEDIDWEGRRLSFSVRPGQPFSDLTVALPTDGHRIKGAWVGAKERRPHMTSLFGREFALIPLGRQTDAVTVGVEVAEG